MAFEYSQWLKPRITDINYGNHLGHMELIGLLHEVRAQFLKKYQISEIEINNSFLVMRHLLVDYTNQAFWDNELKVTMWIEPQKVKIIFKYLVSNLTTNNITAEAEATMVLIDRKSQKVLRATPFFELLNNESHFS